MSMIRATGRRKTAVAQVRLIPGKGEVKVNKQPIADYFPVETNRMTAFRPLELTETIGQFDIQVIVRGGGKSGQTGAMQLALARALVAFDEKFHSTLKAKGLLTRDPRMVERKKYGQKKARKRFQFSKR